MRKAVAYFCNGLGNFVMMMPALQAVASMTDEGKIDIVTNGSWRDSRRPAVEEICEKWVMAGKLLNYPADKLDPRNYDLWFYSSHGTTCEVQSIFLANMDNPIGRPSWRSSFLHEADHYLEIAYGLGYAGPVPDVVFPLADGPELSGKRPIVGVCNGAFKTEQWKKKHWPYFPRLAEVLRKWCDAVVVGVGGPGELKGVALDHDFTGKLTITETAKVISQCDLLIATDTANMHIASLMKVPTIALFGPTLVSKNGPRWHKAIILQSGLECAPCQDTGRFYHCNRYACMEAISVGDVIAAAKRKLEVCEDEHEPDHD
jgi:hypothetical protein